MGIDPHAPAFASRPAGADAPPFIVCAMYTADFRPKAERLVASLKALDLPFAVFEVPHVHRSISVHGTLDAAYCKPRFIAALLAAYRCPVVYVDADFEFCRAPDLFRTYAEQGADFAIYNWLTDLMNDAWAPHLGRPERHPTGHARYWRFGFAIDKASLTQMLCSGGVQYWAPTEAAQGLLAAWENRIVGAPLTPDDENLDFAYNFHPRERGGVNARWLPKEYSRSAHWLYVDPTINHRDIASPRVPGQFQHLDNARVNAAELTDIAKARPFPRAAELDLVAGNVLFTDAGGRAVMMPLTQPFYLYPLDPEGARP